jgi:hypothetical protein
MAHKSYSYNNYDIWLTTTPRSKTISLQVCEPGRPELLKNILVFQKLILTHSQ